MPTTQACSLAPCAVRYLPLNLLKGYYNDEQITLKLEPLAHWCNAEYVQKRVKTVDAAKNTIHMVDGSSLDYDVAVFNVGSKTRGTFSVQGVLKEHTIATRPINDLLGRVVERENYFKE